MAILSKGCKPDNFESQNSLKLSFTNICGLRSNSAECESFLESNSPDILAPCETNLDCSVDSDFLLHGTYIYKTLRILTYVFDWLYFTLCLTSFSSIDGLLRFYAWFLILFHLT